MASIVIGGRTFPVRPYGSLTIGELKRGEFPWRAELREMKEGTGAPGVDFEERSVALALRGLAIYLGSSDEVGDALLDVPGGDLWTLVTKVRALADGTAEGSGKGEARSP